MGNRLLTQKKLMLPLLAKLAKERPGNTQLFLHPTFMTKVCPHLYLPWVKNTPDTKLLFFSNVVNLPFYYQIVNSPMLCAVLQDT